MHVCMYVLHCIICHILLKPIILSFVNVDVLSINIICVSIVKLLIMSHHEREMQGHQHIEVVDHYKYKPRNR